MLRQVVTSSDLSDFSLGIPGFSTRGDPFSYHEIHHVVDQIEQTYTLFSGKTPLKVNLDEKRFTEIRKCLAPLLIQNNQSAINGEALNDLLKELAKLSADTRALISTAQKFSKIKGYFIGQSPEKTPQSDEDTMIAVTTGYNYGCFRGHGSKARSCGTGIIHGGNPLEHLNQVLNLFAQAGTGENRIKKISVVESNDQLRDIGKTLCDILKGQSAISSREPLPEVVWVKSFIEAEEAIKEIEPSSDSNLTHRELIEVHGFIEKMQPLLQRLLDIEESIAWRIHLQRSKERNSAFTHNLVFGGGSGIERNDALTLSLQGTLRELVYSKPDTIVAGGSTLEQIIAEGPTRESATFLRAGQTLLENGHGHKKDNREVLTSNSGRDLIAGRKCRGGVVIVYAPSHGSKSWLTVRDAVAATNAVIVEDAESESNFNPLLSRVKLVGRCAEFTALYNYVSLACKLKTLPSFLIEQLTYVEEKSAKDDIALEVFCMITAKSSADRINKTDKRVRS